MLSPMHLASVAFRMFQIILALTILGLGAWFLHLLRLTKEARGIALAFPITLLVLAAVSLMIASLLSASPHRRFRHYLWELALFPLWAMVTASFILMGHHRRDDHSKPMRLIWTLVALSSVSAVVWLSSGLFGAIVTRRSQHEAWKPKSTDTQPPIMLDNLPPRIDMPPTTSLVNDNDTPPIISKMAPVYHANTSAPRIPIDKIFLPRPADTLV